MVNLDQYLFNAVVSRETKVKKLYKWLIYKGLQKFG